MTEQIRFQCTRCGKCCSKIRGPMLGIISGLMILPSETKLFPKEGIKPLIRNGATHPFAPNRIWMYQVDAESCPRYDAKKKACRIYEKRPLVCRGFPFELSGVEGDHVSIHGSCPEAMRLVEMKASAFVPIEYFRAARKVHEHYTEQLTSVEMERYDLVRGWRNFLDGVTADDVKQIMGEK